jgi:hypothetical protein
LTLLFFEGVDEDGGELIVPDAFDLAPAVAEGESCGDNHGVNSFRSDAGEGFWPRLREQPGGSLAGSFVSGIIGLPQRHPRQG